MELGRRQAAIRLLRHAQNVRLEDRLHQGAASRRRLVLGIVGRRRRDRPAEHPWNGRQGAGR